MDNSITFLIQSLIQDTFYFKLLLSLNPGIWYAKFVEKCCRKMLSKCPGAKNAVEKYRRKFLSLRMLSKNSVESKIRQSFSTIFDILSFF